MQNGTFKRAAALMAVASVISMPASAALVTLNGDNIDIVYDDSQATLAAFGLPTLVGNLVTFSPSNFKASATNDNLDLEANTVNFKIVLHDGYRIQSLALTEGGDYLAIKAGSFVRVLGQTRVYDTAQLPPGVIEPLSAAGLGTVFGSASDPNLQTTNWTASASSDLSGASYAASRELSFSLQNILMAYASPGEPLEPSLAFIEKKFVALDVHVSAVPEAETWAMMLVGACLVGFRLRSRSKKAAAARWA